MCRARPTGGLEDYRVGYTRNGDMYRVFNSKVVCNFSVGNVAHEQFRIPKLPT